MTKGIALVTGGAGFIGSHMVDVALANGYKVRVIDNLVGGRLQNIASQIERNQVEFQNADILSFEPGDRFFDGVTHVFHFAGIGDIVPSIEKPIDYMAVNVQGTVRMLECARAAHVKKFVYAASSSCYGLAQTPTDEAHPIDTKYPYALSKFQGEQAALHWHQVYSLPVNSIRIFNAYGTRSRTSGAYGAVFGVFLKQKLAGKPFTIVGDGRQARDFLYVTDVAKAFLKAGETEHVGQIWNLGAGNPQSVNSLVSLLGGDSVHVPKRPSEPDVTHANITKIVRDLGWNPEISFEQGVQLILNEIEYWREAPLWEPESIAKATETWFKMMSNES